MMGTKMMARHALLLACAVCTCATAAKALEQLRDKTHNFDLVLSDVYMPGAVPGVEGKVHQLTQRRVWRAFHITQWPVSRLSLDMCSAHA